MTTPRINKIGLVAHYSERGDWAFDAALRLARSRGAILNVFSFVESPYEAPLDKSPAEVPAREYDEKYLIQEDRFLREHYEDRLGDFVDVGFRVCESGRHNLELRQCLKRKEYQLLIIPYTNFGATFGNMPIEEFAYRFNAPVMLVGPDRASQYHLNPPAQVIAGSAGLLSDTWTSIQTPSEFQELPVI